MKISLAPESFGLDEKGALDRVWSSGRLTMGEETRTFEEAFARRVSGRNAVMVNSGSSANLVMLAAAHLKPGTEVIVPALTWSTTVWPVLQRGCIPVFVDCDQDTLQMDTDDVAEAIGPRTSAILAVHLMGNACDLDALRDLIDGRHMVLLEDCCEALGTTYGGVHVGSFGLASSFSFFMSHHITTIEGGMIVSLNAEFADRARSIRSHGWTRGTKMENPRSFQGKFEFVHEGYNVRPTELNAALGNVQLPKLDDWVLRRSEVAEAMFAAISTFDWLRPMTAQQNAVCSWFAFPVVVRKGSRDALAQHLISCGIDCRPIVGGNLVRHKAFHGVPKRIIGDLANANDVMDHGLYWGCHQDVTMDGVEALFDAIANFSRTMKGAASA